MQRLFQSPPVPKYRSSFYLHDGLVSAALNDLAIETAWTKNSSDDFLVKPESRMVQKLECSVKAGPVHRKTTIPGKKSDSFDVKQHPGA